MGFTLTPVVVTATGTVTSNLKGTARLASFTFSNHGTTAASAVTFWELTSAGEVAASEKFHITLASASLPGSTMTQVYNEGDEGGDTGGEDTEMEPEAEEAPEA